MAENSYPSPKVRGSDQKCQAAEQEQPRGATPRLSSGAVAEKSNPTSKERQLGGEGQEELLHIQDQEARL